MSIRHIAPVAAILLAACHAPDTSPKSTTVSSDPARIASAILLDYRARYTAAACLDPVTARRSGPEDIPHDLAARAVAWTYLARSGGLSQPVDAQTAAAIDATWQQLRGGSYPSITLPEAQLPANPAHGCDKTLKLTSPMISGINAFVRWSDGINRRTMALRKSDKGWTVLAEGPARIG